MLNWWTDRQTDNGDFIEPSVSWGGGAIMKVTLSFP